MTGQANEPWVCPAWEAIFTEEILHTDECGFVAPDENGDGGEDCECYVGRLYAAISDAIHPTSARPVVSPPDSTEAEMRERARYAQTYDHRGLRNEEAAKLGEDVLGLLDLLGLLAASPPSPQLVETLREQLATADATIASEYAASLEIEAEVARLREAATGARTALRNAQQERTHGQTASAAFIDQCVDSAVRALDAALASVAVGQPENTEGGVGVSSEASRFGDGEESARLVTGGTRDTAAPNPGSSLSAADGTTSE